MKTVILCGGMGTRLAEETHLKPKPLVAVGTHPILWHIMNMYSFHGFNEFMLALGYKGELIKEYFMNFYALNSDFEVDLATGEIRYENNKKTNWKVRLIDTGVETLTGGRLLRLREALKGEKTFMLTYGDGVADVDIRELVRFHKAQGRLATVTAVRPTGRFGAMQIKSSRVERFIEKPDSGEGWINGGFFVFEQGIFEYLENDRTILERSPMERLSRDGQLAAYQHKGFWQCMDTVRDRQLLEENWASGQAPWLYGQNLK